MQIHGTLEEIFDTQEVSASFKKRDFVITTDEQTPYPQSVIMQVTQMKTAALDGFNVGDEVSVDFNIRGRRWEGPQGVKFFNTIEAWKITLVNKNSNTRTEMRQEAVKAEPTTQTVNINPVTPTYNTGSDNDDLPF